MQLSTQTSGIIFTQNPNSKEIYLLIMNIESLNAVHTFSPFIGWHSGELFRRENARAADVNISVEGLSLVGGGHKPPPKLDWTTI
jgi:hypothetical protein